MARANPGELFPTDQPIAADQMIGRERDVEEIRTKLAGATNVVLAAPRRTGKTSVCDAAVDRLAAEGTHVIKVDLWETADIAELAQALVTQTIANRPAVRRVLAKVRETGRAALGALEAKSVTTLTGELGDDVEIAFSGGLAARDPERAFDYALRLPQRVAEADGVRCVVFFDEFQGIVNLEAVRGDREARQKRMRSVFQRSSRCSYLFAGSIEHMMRDIFGSSERPFSQFGGLHDLSPISTSQWRSGIRERYGRDASEISDGGLDALLEFTSGHPRATMLVAQHAHVVAVLAGSRTINEATIRTACGQALRADRGRCEALVDHVRRLGGKATGRNAGKTIRRIARGEAIYRDTDKVPSDTQRAVEALLDAGLIEETRSRPAYRIGDPLLRHFLAGIDPARV